MEYWKDGILVLRKDVYHLIFLKKIFIKAFDSYFITQHSIVPVFQHSRNSK